VYFADPVGKPPCPSCKKRNEFAFTIKTGRYNIPVHQRTKLYACHTEKDSDDFAAPAGVAAPKDGGFELKNVSDKTWTVTRGGGTSTVAKGASFALAKGSRINFGGETAEII
jgi:hypothetical protein